MEEEALCKEFVLNISDKDKTKPLKTNSAKKGKQNHPKKLSILTWSLTGQDTRKLKRRSYAVIDVIRKHKVDIVFLQDTVNENGLLLELQLGRNYTCIKGLNENGTGTLTFLRIRTVEYISHYTTKFRNTETGKNMLITEANVAGINLQLVNVQFERSAALSEARMEQFKTSVHRCLQFQGDCTVILAGDMNLHHYEEVDPLQLCDTWNHCGSKMSDCFTFDMIQNSNISRLRHKKIRERFDRIYLRFSENEEIVPNDLIVVGREKVSDTGLFPSCHFGVLVECTLKK